MECVETPGEESGLGSSIMAGESNGEKTQPPKPPLNSNNKEDKKKPKQKRSPIIIYDHITVLSGHPLRYKCNICTREFKTKLQIKYHEFCRGGEKPFKCDECDKSFISKSHYQCHLRGHTGERPYVCQECGIGFNQSGKLNRHLKSHAGEKPFVCNQGCGRKFASAQALKSHSYTHTGEKPFSCQYCDKKFTAASNLIKHIRVHTGEKPFHCQVCRKCFAKKWTLDVHMKTHSRTHPSESKECPRSFSAFEHLPRHSLNDATFQRNCSLDRHIENTDNKPEEVVKQLTDETVTKYLAERKKRTSQDSKEVDDWSQPGENRLEDQFTAELIPNESSENVTTSIPPDDETMPQIVNVYSLASLDTSRPHSNNSKSLLLPLESSSLVQPDRSIMENATSSSEIFGSAFVMSKINAGTCAVMTGPHRPYSEHNYVSYVVFPAKSDQHTSTFPPAPFQNANKSSMVYRENGITETTARDQNNRDQRQTLNSGCPGSKVISKGIGPGMDNLTRQPQTTRMATSNQVPATSTCENLMEIVGRDASSHTLKSPEVYGFGAQNLTQPVVKIASRSGDASLDLKKLLRHSIQRKNRPSSAQASFSAVSSCDLLSKAFSAPTVARVSVPATAEPENLHSQSGMNSVTSSGGSSTSSVSTEAKDNSSSNVPSAAELISKLKVETASLKSESLWLIAGQESTKIRCSNKNWSTCGAEAAISDFAIPVANPMASGDGFAFHSSTFNGHPCVLFLQEQCDHKISHSCIEIMEEFTGSISGKYCSWSSGGQDEEVQLSVLPHCIVSSVANFIGSPTPGLGQKHFVLLSSLTYWGQEHMSDLLVFSDVKDPHLVHVVPAYTSPSDLRRKLQISSTRDFDDFQRALKQLLLQSKILSDAELQVFFNILSGSRAQVQTQLNRFLQIKLFSSKFLPEDLAEFKASQSQRVFVEWLRKERDFCVFEFMGKALKSHSRSISPLKRAYIEFLAVPDSSAKQLLDLILEICQ